MIITVRVNRVPLIAIMSAGMFGLGAGSLQAQDASSPPTVEAAGGAGRKVYLQQCARCHGVEGKGDGYDAKRLYPRPRDLTSGTFKFRTTASGTAPTDQDLFNTITNGLTAGGMPDWKHLDESVRWQLVAYLKTLTTNFEDNPAQPLDFGADPGPKAVNLSTGKEVYTKLGCASCHGAGGRANGPSAAGFSDNWEMPIRPANLTQGWSYRAGNEPADIVRRVLSGIDGSPMPSYAEAATPDELWQLAHYVRSLQEEPHWTMIARVPQVEGSLPEAPDDARWASAPKTDVRLRNAVTPEGQMANPETVSAVSFRALHNGEALALRVSWDDPSEDRQDPGDALGIAFLPHGVAGDIVTLQTWPLAAAPELDWLTWSARSGLREAVAHTYDEVFAVTASMDPGHISYQDGRWTLVLHRPFAPPVAGAVGGAAALAPGAFAPIAFAAWDGGNRNLPPSEGQDSKWGQRVVSQFIELSFERSAGHGHESKSKPPFVWIISGIVVLIALVRAIRPRPR